MPIQSTYLLPGYYAGGIGDLTGFTGVLWSIPRPDDGECRPRDAEKCRQAALKVRGVVLVAPMVPPAVHRARTTEPRQRMPDLLGVAPV
jgi:hypothetical protein